MATSLRPMRWPVSLAAAVLACCALALPAGAQETTPEAGGAAAPAPTATAPATTPTTTPTTTATTPSTTSTTPAAATGSSAGDDGDGLSPLLVGAAVLVALSLLALVLWGIARVFAWEPGWLPVARHAFGEAGYRTGATWAEFRDWLRLRR